MEGFVQAAGLALIATVLGLALERQNRDISVVLAVVAGVLILSAAMVYLKPVLDFLEELQSMTCLSMTVLTPVIKITGIAVLTEFTAMICADGGNAALGKALQILGAMVILWLSVPIFAALMELIQEILGSL